MDSVGLVKAATKATKLADSLEVDDQELAELGDRVDELLYSMAQKQELVEGRETMLCSTVELPKEIEQKLLWEKVKRISTKAERNALKSIDEHSENLKDMSDMTTMKSWYMENTTKAFASDLEQMRQESNFGGGEDDMEVLIECLQLGLKEPIFGKSCSSFFM